MDEIDDRVCLFYVSERLKEIWDMFQEDETGASINKRKEQE